MGDVRYAYDGGSPTGDDPDAGVDVAPEVVVHEVAAPEAKGVASILASDVRLQIVLGAVLSLVLIFAVLCFCSRSPKERSRPAARTALPAFDVEGGGTGIEIHTNRHHLLLLPLFIPVEALRQRGWVNVKWG